MADKCAIFYTFGFFYYLQPPIVFLEIFFISYRLQFVHLNQCKNISKNTTFHGVFKNTTFRGISHAYICSVDCGFIICWSDHKYVLQAFLYLRDLYFSKLNYISLGSSYARARCSYVGCHRLPPGLDSTSWIIFDAIITNTILPSMVWISTRFLVMNPVH